MTIFLDTNVLLNDFFHRNPDFGFQRIADPAQMESVSQYRALVHETLLWLSLKPDVRVATSTFILSRLASLFGDLLVPADLVENEMAYYLANFKILEPGIADLEKAQSQMAKAEIKLDFDDYLTRNLAMENGIDLILTSLPKSREFFWPVLVFKPEKIRELNWEALGSK